MKVEEEQFPIGMRVLAVDDDPTCLLLMETLLRRCQYNVTTTTKATKALEMLKENKNKFDLVISDVHMPDMDGFKLLELVGLMMDLPVVMVSANSDPNLVMKGINHGACDYLLKHVRIEELKNIWQHVVRRKKFDYKDRSNLDNQDNSGHGSCEVTADKKLNKTRKDQNEDDDEDCDENGNENEDPTTQKKPRVIWSVELHHKFVAAVNQLGIDKAVPKKILDLMNVEKLTRENVASHLQKYRLYLKRISCVANPHDNMVGGLSGTDSPYLQVGPMTGLGTHNLTEYAQFNNTAFGSLPPSGMLGRLNSPASLGLRGLSSTGAYQLGCVQTPSHLNDGQSHFCSVLNYENKGKILHAMAMPLEFDQIRSSTVPSCNSELPADIADTGSFSANSLTDAKMISGGSNNSFLGVSNNPSMLEGHCLVPLESQDLGKQSSVAVASLDAEFFSHLVNQGRLNDWSSDVQSTGVLSTSLSDRFEQATLSPNNLRNGMSTMALQSGIRPFDGSSIIPTLPIHLQECKPEFECNEASVNNGRQIINSSLPGWDDHRGAAIYHLNDVFSSLNTSIHGVESPTGHSLDTQNTAFLSTVTFSLTGNPHLMDPLTMNQNEIVNSTRETMRMEEGSKMVQQKHPGSYDSSDFRSMEYLEDGVGKQESDAVKLTGDLGFGDYSLGKCMEKYS